MDRRKFLRSAGAVAASALIPDTGLLFASRQNPETWRTFEVTTRIEVAKPSGETRVWAPAALIGNTPWQRTLAGSFHAGKGTVRLAQIPDDSLGIVTAQFPPGVPPVLTVTRRVATRNYQNDLSASPVSRLSARERSHFLRPTKFMPTDGIVREQSIRITQGATTDIEKARAIYEWIVDNTFRSPRARGCGIGNIRFMLESGDLGGKCADLNGLYVALARAAGLPARDVYGIRVAPSEFGYKSLGASSENVTKAQHCRAEVYLEPQGWVPVDPADVRKVVLEEPPGNLALDDDRVKAARARLFGFWEMNWIAYNYANDVDLPGSSGPSLAFLMYPQAETSEGRLDSLDPDNFKYEIATKEIFASRA